MEQAPSHQSNMERAMTRTMAFQATTGQVVRSRGPTSGFEYEQTVSLTIHTWRPAHGVVECQVFQGADGRATAVVSARAVAMTLF